MLFFVCNLYGQQTKYDQYDIHINQANQLKAEGKFKEAINEYKKGLGALERHSTSTPFFHIAACAIQIQDFDLAKKYISLGITKGGAVNTYLNRYEGFDETFKKSSQWGDIYANYDNLRKEYFSTVRNIDIYIEVEKMVEADQVVRSHYGNMVLDEKKNLACRDSFDSVMMSVDDKNIMRLIEITKEYGWQKRAWVLLWHQRGTYKEDNFVWNFFIPHINKEIEEGKISRSFWAMFEDSRSLRYNGYTLYGELPGRVDENVNKRRESVNLLPLTEQEIEERNNDDMIIF